jgi:hypothetical protein
MHCFRSLGSRDHGFESHTGIVFVRERFSVFVYRQMPFDVLITHPRSPADYLRSSKLK